MTSTHGGELMTSNTNAGADVAHGTERTMKQAWIRDYPEAVVRLRGVVKRYRATTALAGLDLAVPAGSVYALVGPNGAGKSTTMRLLLDLARPDAGAIDVLGAEPRRAPALRARIGYVPERHDWHALTWTAGQAMRYHARLHPTWDAAYASRLARVLKVDASRRLHGMSKGESRRLQLLLALAPRPELLLLDEPTDGLDPVVRDEVWGVLADYLADDGATALVSTHHVHEVERMASHYGAIRDGRIVAQLPVEEIRGRVRDYRLAVPDGWSVPPSLNGNAVGRRQGAAGPVYMVIGDEGRTTDLFRSSGADVVDVHRPTLEETTIRLLAGQTAEAAR
jgi:ABC-2 type transport system ATP-binding protein